MAGKTGLAEQFVLYCSLVDTDVRQHVTANYI